MEAKVISCNSCGAALCAITQYCKCQYCGNTNKVMADGKTIIYQKAPAPPTPANTPIPSAPLPLWQKVILCVLVIIGGLYLHRIMRKTWL